MRDIRDDEFYGRIAAQVVARRTELLLSQRELAELCGTTQSAIARFESGTRPPKLDTLIRIAEALDCELDVEFRPRTRPVKK
ncbi:helix-turn-helix domain-containing protein [Aeromicrobium sp.]|uniref:helix-turn-helix domain-containing protein n=1 Tax=Aeromicrobium sp. TaxID=1871063 RepID=UPI002FC6D5D3